MATIPSTDDVRPVTPSDQIPVPLRAGLFVSVTEARKIAEALVTIQQVAGRVGLHLIDKLDVHDGDPDHETCAIEDDDTPMPKEIDFGPGCAVADAGGQHANEDDPSAYDCVDDKSPGCVISDPDCCVDDRGEQDQDGI